MLLLLVLAALLLLPAPLLLLLLGCVAFFSIALNFACSGMSPSAASASASAAMMASKSPRTPPAASFASGNRNTSMSKARAGSHEPMSHGALKAIVQSTPMPFHLDFGNLLKGVHINWDTWDVPDKSNMKSLSRHHTHPYCFRTPYASRYSRFSPFCPFDELLQPLTNKQVRHAHVYSTHTQHTRAHTQCTRARANMHTRK